jgi:hypothetical protein
VSACGRSTWTLDDIPNVMPTFEVVVEGRGIRFPVEGTEAGVFYRIVRVVAANRDVAENEAMTTVRSEWDSGPRARLNRGSAPRLRIEQVSQLPWWHRFLPNRRGYIFAPEDGGGDVV